MAGLLGRDFKGRGEAHRGQGAVADGHVGRIGGLDRSRARIGIDVFGDADHVAGAVLQRRFQLAPRAFDAPVFTKGDVLVVNDNMAHYRGEIQIAVRDIPNDGVRNRVGRIPEEEQFLLDYILPEHPFGFIR